ncbi:hypothetical protein OROHE_021517 [Orobanche hederae]
MKIGEDRSCGDSYISTFKEEFILAKSALGRECRLG